MHGLRGVRIHSFGGLAVAIGLKTKWGFNDFVVSSYVPKHHNQWNKDVTPQIYERGADIGGTWRVSLVLKGSVPR